MTGRQYSDGDFIYRAGDPADGVYRVRSGPVNVDFLRRNEFLALLSLNPAWVAPAISRAFDLVDNALPPDEPAEPDVPVNGADGPAPSAPE
jgi:hypothetical protein